MSIGGTSPQVVRVPQLDAVTRATMLDIYQSSFSALDDFHADLESKDWVVLLYGDQGLAGFSTLGCRVEMLDQPSLVFFSGDTVVRPGQRDRFDLHQLWSRHVFALAAQQGLPCYWFLICSGFRTYRFLPTFFRRFYPRYDEPTPPQVQHWLDQLASARFGSLYDPASGIVRLRSACLEQLPARRLDQHSAFFLERNPDWHQGHELACLTWLEPENLTPAGRRMAAL